MLKLISLALIILLAASYTPQNPYCDAANTGDKVMSYAVAQNYNYDNGYKIIGSTLDTGTHSSAGTVDCTILALVNGDSYRMKCIREYGNDHHQTASYYTPTELVATYDRVILIKVYNAEKTSF